MATIIRKDDPVEAPSARSPQPVSFSFADMRGQANNYLDTVRAEAAKIVQQAHQQAEQIRRQAETAGRKAAESAVERVLDEKVGKRMSTLLPALEQLVREINDTKGQLLAHWEHSALHVSSAIAERIVRREIAQKPQITLGLITESLRLATGAASIKLRISPSDYGHLGSQISRLTETLAGLAPSEVIADPTIEAGGCRVETQFGEIDQRIESQLRRIEEELS
jgi:flagellar assembly protein FliH